MSATCDPVHIRELETGDVEAAIDVISEHVLDEKAEERRPVIAQAARGERAGGVVVEVCGDIAGCMVYTLHGEDESLSDELSRPVPHTTDGQYAILRYAYLRQDEMGRGLGTRMLERVLDKLSNRDLPPVAVYVEAWHRPDELDLRPLLDKFAFDPVFVSEEYWAHPLYSGRENICPDCNVSHVECDCGAGVYRRTV